MQATDIQIEDISYRFQDFLYRTPIKFGGVATDRVSILDVDCVVSTRAGKRAKGFGSMPFGNVWSFPSRVLSFDDTLGAMKALTEPIARITADYHEAGHPIDLTWALEPRYHQAAAELSERLRLLEPIPPFCTLVGGRAFDA